MNGMKLMMLSLFAFVLTLVSTAQTNEKKLTAPPAKTTQTKTTTTTTTTSTAVKAKVVPRGKAVAKKAHKPLPPQAATKAKMATSKTSIAKTGTIKTTAPVPPSAPTTQPGTKVTLGSAPKTSTGTITTPPAKKTATPVTPPPTPPATSTGKVKVGTGTDNPTQPTQTQTTPQTTTPGKVVVGTGTGTNPQTTIPDGNLNQFDAASAIKEALMKGVTEGVNKVAVTDGYFKNSMIKIPFPQDAKVIETTLRQMGMGSMIDNLVMSLNRAAENAATQAGPIFLNGIKQMTVPDAINIVSNQQPDAATQFLQRTTTESLVSAFKPSIQTALDKTLATKYWSEIMSTYNRIPFVQKINPDLNDFVTRKAISGLFYMIGQEEAKIRKNPVGQGSQIIEKVFGGLLKR